MDQNHSLKFASRSCCIILVTAAAAKLWTVVGGMKFLDLYDPLLLLPTREILVLVAVIELLCCWRISRIRSFRHKGLIVLWLASNFLLYHLALMLSGAPSPCPCFGSVGTRFGLDKHASQLLTMGMSFYMLVCGIHLLRGHGVRKDFGSSLGIPSPAAGAAEP